MTEIVDSHTVGLAAKRHGRITDGRMAIRQAEAFIRSYPAASATPAMRSVKLALQGLIDEIEAAP